MTPDTEKSAGSRPLNNSLTFPTPQKGWLPLILIIGLTIVIFIVSIISLLSGWQTIFQNLFYFPIILACVYYVRRGFVFSVVLACSYFVLMAIFSNDLVVLEGALIRVLIFILVAGVITYLSMIRIRAEDALKESKGRYRSLYTDSKDAIMIVSPEQGFLAANPATIRLFACRDEQDFTGHTPASLSPEYQPDGLSSTGKSREMMRLALENGSHFFEWTHRRVDGTDFPATVLLSRVESGGKQLLQATVRDITEHKQIVEVLRESEARFRTIINSMQFGIVIIDAHTHTILEANRKSLEMIGGSNESAIGSVCHRFICPAETGRCPVTDLGQTVDSSERVLLTMRGEKIPILKSVIKMMLGGKEVLVESFIDISERKEAEEALRETTEYLNNLFDYANAPIITWDPGFHITRFNHAFERLTGRNQEEVLGKTLDLLFPDETRNASMTLIQKAVEGERWEVVEIPILIKDGSVRTVLWNSANILGPKGRIISTIAQGVDISERKELENEIDYHAQELQRYSTSLAMANKKLTLLSSITRHDINNQLTVLIGYLELLEMKQPDASFSTYFNNITGAAERIQAMIQFTKIYEGIGVNAPVWQNTRTLVDTAVKDVVLGHIQVINDMPAGTMVFADQLIVKVFFNLMDNAVRYGGKITTIRFSIEQHGSDQVIVCEDDGDGVAPGEKEKIFERGFGKNTGLGLFLSREILSITGIMIRETGEPGKGAWFEMTVPEGSLRHTDNGN